MHTREKKGIVVAGVDVGGEMKGFHAVALCGGRFDLAFASKDASEIADWCRNVVRAQVVGVDAPCRWSLTGRARPAERELMAEKKWCFSTPSREAAEAHPKNHYGWMLNGAALYQQLEKAYSLFAGNRVKAGEPVCFETFPQAIACALAGEIVSAKCKRSVRSAILNRAGVDISGLSNIDMIDAALCALAAYRLALGDFKPYGKIETGLIVVPKKALAR